MEFPETEKDIVIDELIFILNNNLSSNEKELFYKYLGVLKLTDKDFFTKGLSFIYTKNNLAEFNVLDYNQELDLSKGYSDDDATILFNGFLLTPKIIAIYSEYIRKTMDLNMVLILYYSNISSFNKIIDHFLNNVDGSVEIISIIEGWKNIIKQRIDEVQSQIEFQKHQIELSPIKQPTVLVWKGKQTELSKISKKIRSLGFTNKPTDFEKVFTEKKPTEWLGSYYVLAHLIYSLGNKTLEDKKISSSDRSGYMAVASLYFTDCNCVTLSHLKINLNDLSYKVRNSKSEHSDIKEIVDNILSTSIQK